MYKVLIVDDEYLIREGLAKEVPWHEMGFEISGTAANSREAIACIEKIVPHVVLTDVKMPVMDGIELCKVLKYRYPHIKTVILSGYGEFEYAQKAIEYNVHSYILKPLNVDDLLELFQNIYNELQIQSRGEKNISASEDGLNIDRDEMTEYVFLKLLSREFNDYARCGEELAKVGFDAKNKYYCIMAFSYSNIEKKADGKTSSESLLRLAKCCLRQSGFEALYLDGIFYIVICSDKPIAQRDQNHFSKKFKDFMEEKLNIGDTGGTNIISMGVSSVCRDLAQLRHSADEAAAALNYRYYSGEGSVIFYKESVFDKNKSWNNSEVETAVNNISAGLLNNCSYTVVSTLKGLFSYLSSVNILDKNRLHIKFIQIYSAIAAEIKKEYIFITVLTEDEFYNRISGCETFKKLEDLFKDAVLEIEAQIKDYNLTSYKYRFIQKVKRYIDSNYSDRLSLDRLSRDFFINSTYLSRIFKEEADENLSDYILSVRMENAKRMLNTSDAKVQDISKQVGYVDYRHFCTVFKKVTGMTPLQYRIKSV